MNKYTIMNVNYKHILDVEKVLFYSDDYFKKFEIFKVYLLY